MHPGGAQRPVVFGPAGFRIELLERVRLHREDEAARFARTAFERVAFSPRR